MAKKSAATASSAPKEVKAAKEYKLDLFKQTLPALHACDMNFWDRCSEDARKEIGAYILMRYTSCIARHQKTAPIHVNSLVNVGFNRLKNHPELQWKLLCVAASDITTERPAWGFHKFFVPKSKKTKTPLLDELLIQKHPNTNDFEIGILRDKLENEDNVKEFCRQFGLTDIEIKAVVKEFKDVYGKKA